MARNGKSKSKGRSGAASKKIKVSMDEAKSVDAVVEEEDSGPWNGTRVISVEENILCRSEGCEDKATATWTSMQTEDSWDMCDKCQKRDFDQCYRGESPSDDSKAKSVTEEDSGSLSGREGSSDCEKEEVTESSSVDKVHDLEDKTGAPIVDAPLETVEHDENEDLGPWEGTRVISAEENIKCRSEGCKHKATATWASMQTGDAWDMCNECQVRDFGDLFQAKNNSTTPSTGKEPIEISKHQYKTDAKEETPVVPAPDAMDVDSVSKSVDAAEKADNAKPPAVVGARLVEPEQSDKTLAPCTPKKDQVKALAIPVSAEPKMVSSDSEAASESDAMSDPAPSSAENLSDDQDMESEDEGQYDLKKILTFEELAKPDNICCSKEECGGLPAFGLYVNSKDLKDRWYYCLDCQEDDFDGWPPLEELPTKYIEPRHLKLIASKCSRRKNMEMPAFPMSSSPQPKTNCGKSNLVTPPPRSLDVKGSSSDDKTAQAASGKSALKTSKAVALHAKWREAAQAMGGKDARIVVSLPIAKKLVFDYLYEEFRPMNITQIYKGLKAVVPQPVLNACLQEMIPDQFNKNPFDEDDSDGEDAAAAKEVESKPYAQSLMFKAGKNLSNNLYYVDHKKLQAMTEEERRDLQEKLATSKAEGAELTMRLQAIKKETADFLNQPTNEELVVKLQQEEASHEEVAAKLEAAGQFKVNEKHRKKLKQKVERMAVYWRQRRRLVFEFLTSLEENTDGSVTRRKCLKGDGPIFIDSDESVATAAAKFAQDKKLKSRNKFQMKRKNSLAGKGTGKQQKESGRDLASNLESTLVAVTLDQQLKIVRVHVDD